MGYLLLFYNYKNFMKFLQCQIWNLEQLKPSQALPTLRYLQNKLSHPLEVRVVLRSPLDYPPCLWAPHPLFLNSAEYTIILTALPSFSMNLLLCFYVNIKAKYVPQSHTNKVLCSVGFSLCPFIQRFA